MTVVVGARTHDIIINYPFKPIHSKLAWESVNFCCWSILREKYSIKYLAKIGPSWVLSGAVLLWFNYFAQKIRTVTVFLCISPIFYKYANRAVVFGAAFVLPEIPDRWDEVSSPTVSCISLESLSAGGGWVKRLSNSLLIASSMDW